MVYQVILEVQDPEVNREKEALLVNQVTQETADCRVIKVSVCCSQLGFDPIVFLNRLSANDYGHGYTATTLGKEDCGRQNNKSYNILSCTLNLMYTADMHLIRVVINPGLQGLPGLPGPSGLVNMTQGPEGLSGGRGQLGQQGLVGTYTCFF